MDLVRAVHVVASGLAPASDSIGAPRTAAAATAASTNEPSRFTKALDDARRIARMGPWAVGFALALPQALMRQPRGDSGGVSARKPIANVDPKAVANAPMPFAPPMGPGPSAVLAGRFGGPTPVAATPAGALATAAAVGTRAAAPYIVNAGINIVNSFMEGVDAAYGAPQRRNAPDAKGAGHRVVNDDLLGEVDVNALQGRVNDQIKQIRAGATGAAQDKSTLLDHFQRNSDQIRESMRNAVARVQADPANTALRQRVSQAIEQLRESVVLPANAHLTINDALEASIVLD